MSEIFLPRRLEKGDEIRVDSETRIPVTQGLFDQPERQSFAVGEIWPNEILLTYDEYHYAVLDQVLRKHITKVTRKDADGNNVQIFPRPACPFKVGDRVRRTRNPERVRTVRITEWCPGLKRKGQKDRWRLWFADDDGDLWTAYDCELAPPEPEWMMPGRWVTHAEHGTGIVRWHGKHGTPADGASVAFLRDFLEQRDPRHVRIANLKPYEPPNLIREYNDCDADNCTGAGCKHWQRFLREIPDRYILIAKEKP